MSYQFVPFRYKAIIFPTNWGCLYGYRESSFTNAFRINGKYFAIYCINPHANKKIYECQCTDSYLGSCHYLHKSAEIPPQGICKEVWDLEEAYNIFLEDKKKQKDLEARLRSPHITDSQRSCIEFDLTLMRWSKERMVKALDRMF